MKEANENQKIKEYIKNGSRGDLYLRNTQITSLPEGLKVGGSLYLRNTPITSLPKGLTVGGDLDLYNTPITSLPEGILFECLESICYLNIHYAEDYCETISVDKAKKIIEFLNKFVQAKERK